METLNKIVTKDVYRELQASHLPIFIWEAGAMAVEVYNRLKENGISADGFSG